ncbi:MAG: YihY/virulence factor BrkB family protein [Defluviitaleaceae bacterium]|nr:YihY/virulence factor BrkB family protein [Defluviitaleaceae bacterium]
MFRFLIFIFNLVLQCNRVQIFERAAGLTFRVLLAFFPFLVFLMALMGFMDLDAAAILSGLYDVLPGEVSELVSGFVAEILGTRSAGVLSAALFFSIYNTVNGFRAVVRTTDGRERGFFAQVGLSFALMLLFSAALIVMLGLLVFWRGIIGWVGAPIVLFVFTSFIYRLAQPYKMRVYPGAIFTVAAWVVTSVVFGFVTSNFSQLPAIYGSVAGIFILCLWLNAVAIILLIGGEINSLLHEFIHKATTRPA